MKKIASLILTTLLAISAFAQSEYRGKTVLVDIPVTENITGSEKEWLPGQVQDSLKSNMQEYLEVSLVADSIVKKAVKQIQRESESAAYDENDMIEIGKFSSAKYAVFTTIRIAGTKYTVSLDFTDLTTAKVLASVTSNSYSNVEDLFARTGAVDELTLALCKKLGVQVSATDEAVLTNAVNSFDITEQLEIARKNEEKYRQLMSDYDRQLETLMTSNDITAIQNKNRIEAEKALLAEKQNAEKKRQEELNAQKARAEEDAKLEAERSIELRNQRDQLAREAAAKAAEVRKLKMEKQGVLGQINLIEAKKKALVEIRQGVEARCVELHEQLVKDRESEEKRIRGRALGTSEKDSEGNQTEQSKKRRENQVIKSYEELTNKFFDDCDAVWGSTNSQQMDLLTEIRADQDKLKVTRTVSSMGDEFKVSFGSFDGSKNGWKTFISLYSDGILIYTDTVYTDYEALSGKKAPTESELEDFDIADEYDMNIDMYSSLLTRGDPVVYFEMDYSVKAETDDKPSQYKFNFEKIRVINTVSGKVTQTSALNKVQPRAMKPEWDLKDIVGIVDEEKTELEALEKYFEKGKSLSEAKIAVARDVEVAKLFEAYDITMVDIPGTTYKMLNTEVTQKLYKSIMGSNPSNFKGDNNPVERVSWYDAIYFCNKLSEKFGYTPVYAVNGKTNVTTWNYTSHNGNSISGSITQNENANGFRLPTVAEWLYAAKGGQNYEYSGSNNLDEVGWYYSNSGNETHPVAQKKPNGYGLYDMSGNVWEWCWDSRSDHYRCNLGGSYYNNANYCEVDHRYSDRAYRRSYDLGFRIVCSPFN